MLSYKVAVLTSTIAAATTDGRNIVVMRRGITSMMSAKYAVRNGTLHRNPEFGALIHV